MTSFFYIKAYTLFSEGLFSVLECNPLHTRILCCLELMDITKQCGSFSVMLCQALMCSCFWLLLVSGFLVFFSLAQVKSMLI